MNVSLKFTKDSEMFLYACVPYAIGIGHPPYAIGGISNSNNISISKETFQSLQRNISGSVKIFGIMFLFHLQYLDS